jgi:hypothetical protein
LAVVALVAHIANRQHQIMEMILCLARLPQLVVVLVLGILQQELAQGLETAGLVAVVLLLMRQTQVLMELVTHRQLHHLRVIMGVLVQ